MPTTRRDFIAASALLATSARAGGPAARAEDAADPTPEEIIARMGKVYAGARSYQDDGEAITVFRAARWNWTVLKPFHTRFVRPKLYRYEFAERDGDGEDDWRRYVIWSEAAPERAKTWWTIQPEVREASLAMAVGTAVGVSASTSAVVPSLLMPKDLPRSPAVSLKGLKLVGEEPVDGAACRKLTGKNIVGNPVTLWIEKETYLLRKVFETSKIPGHDIEQTTSYRPRLDVEIAPEEFRFEPPKP